MRRNLGISYSAYGGALFFSLLLSISFLVYIIIVYWKLLKKSGDNGWKVLIPIYGQYCLYKAFNSVLYFWLSVLTLFLDWLNLRLVRFYSTYLIFDTVYSICMLIMYILVAIRTAKCFRKGGGFAVGLIFLPLIFHSILAFGSAKHINFPEETEEEDHAF